MARPLRRDVIGLSIRLGIDYRVIETWPIPRIAEYMAILRAMNRPPKNESAEQSPEEVERRLKAAYGNPPGE